MFNTLNRPDGEGCKGLTDPYQPLPKCMREGNTRVLSTVYLHA